MFRVARAPKEIKGGKLIDWGEIGVVQHGVSYIRLRQRGLHLRRAARRRIAVAALASELESKLETGPILA